MTAVLESIPKARNFGLLKCMIPGLQRLSVMCVVHEMLFHDIARDQLPVTTYKS